MNNTTLTVKGCQLSLERKSSSEDIYIVRHGQTFLAVIEVSGARGTFTVTQGELYTEERKEVYRLLASAK